MKGVVIMKMYLGLLVKVVGLMKYDVIMELGGKKVISLVMLWSVLYVYLVNDIVMVKYYYNGKFKIVNMKLMEIIKMLIK